MPKAKSEAEGISDTVYKSPWGTSGARAFTSLGQSLRSAQTMAGMS